MHRHTGRVGNRGDTTTAPPRGLHLRRINGGRARSVAVKLREANFDGYVVDHPSEPVQSAAQPDPLIRAQAVWGKSVLERNAMLPRGSTWGRQGCIARGQCPEAGGWGQNAITQQTE